MDAHYLFETDAHSALREQARRFAAQEIRPHALAWEEAGEFPRALYGACARAGLLGVGYPEELGGSAGDLSHMLVVAEEFILEGHSVGTAVGLGSHAIALPPIIAWGTEAQRQRLVPPVLRGEHIAALAITEPGTGSDVASVATRAVRDGDNYVVNGTKMFITSGTRADLVTTLVRTGEPGHNGVSLLAIERLENGRQRPGFSASKKLRKMGWWASDTAELTFVDCRVSADCMISDENSGFSAVMGNFAVERILLAAQATAIGQLALREALAYAQQRQAFGKSLTGFQVTRHKLADMSTRLAAARALTGEVVIRHLRGEGDAAQAAKAKNAATDALMWVVDQAVQIHGGYGFMREYTVERLYRDARLYPIGGGTREIMNEIIAKMEGF